MGQGNSRWRKPPLGKGLAELFGMGEEDSKALFEKAKRLEAEGRFIEAFHYYLLASEKGDPSMAAKALNNASLILYEHHGEWARQIALHYLEKAIHLDPGNELLRENWSILQGEEKA